MENLNWQIEEIKNNIIVIENENEEIIESIIEPIDLDVDTNNNIYIINSNTITIERMNYINGEYSDPTVIDGFPKYNSSNYISNVIVDKTGNILFIESDRKILQIDNDGRLLEIHDVEENNSIKSLIVDDKNNLIFIVEKKINYRYVYSIELLEHDTGNVINLKDISTTPYRDNLYLAKNPFVNIYYMIGSHIYKLDDDVPYLTYEQEEPLDITCDIDGNLLVLFRYHVEIVYHENRYKLCDIGEDHGYPYVIAVDYNGDVIITTDQVILKCYKPRLVKSAMY